MVKKKYYDGHDMLNEDKSAPSNCPTDVKMKEYPSNDYINAPVSDNLAGIDMQMDSAVNNAKRQLAKKKY